MYKPDTKSLVAAALIVLGTTQIASAQSANRVVIKKDVQPIAYWIESSSLSLRDNPVAGNVVGNLDYGQKVLGYDQYENWVRISEPGTKEKWVNSDFLSNSRLTFTSYGRSLSSSKSDINLVRIKDPDNRKNRTFGVRLKKSESGNALITTQKQTEKGTYYQNRFVSCKKDQAVGVRLIGEGSTFLRAQNDVRNLGMDIFSEEQIDDKANNSAESAISSFACKTKAF